MPLYETLRERNDKGLSFSECINIFAYPLILSYRNWTTALFLDICEVSLPANAIVETALKEFLTQRGYLPRQRQSLHLTPAPKGSGFQDTSVNHDKILAEQASQKLPPNTP